MRKKSAYAKFRLDEYIQAAYPSVQVFIAIGIYTEMLPFADMHFIYGNANENAQIPSDCTGERFTNVWLPDLKTLECFNQQLCERGLFLASRLNAGLAKMNETLVWKNLFRIWRMISQVQVHDRWLGTFLYHNSRHGEC